MELSERERKRQEWRRINCPTGEMRGWQRKFSAGAIVLQLVLGGKFKPLQHRGGMRP